MAKARLNDFFEQHYFGAIAAHKNIYPEKHLADLTWQQLGEVAFMIMLKEKVVSLPEGCILGAYAIEYLTRQCQAKGLEIF